jgi:hypothetical protein
MGAKVWNRIPLGSVCCESRHESGVGIHHGVRGKGVGSRSVADGGSLFPGVAFVLNSVRITASSLSICGTALNVYVIEI